MPAETKPATTDPLGFAARVTPQLRAAVTQQQGLLAPSDFADLMSGIRGLFEKYSAKLTEFAPGAQRARAVHQLIDREMKAANALPLSCGKGCAGCCSYEVEVTVDEAALLADAVRGGVTIDRTRLAAQAARERKSPEWRQFGRPDNRCVFLGADGACGIYESRPSICRKHVVTSPASACTTDGAPVAPVQVLLAEIVLSAALSQPGVKFSSLSKLLSAALAEDALVQQVEIVAPARQAA